MRHSMQIIFEQLQCVYENPLKNAPHSIEETLRLSLIMQGHFQQEFYRKIIGFRLVCSTQSIIFPRPYTEGKLFRSLQNVLNNKQFSQDQVKMLVKNFLNSKSSEFYLWGIIKRLDKWWGLIQNNGEYTIDRNSFILKLSRNKLYYLWVNTIYS